MQNKDLSASSSKWDNVLTIKKARPSAKDMPDMLSQLNLELEGRHHSGIDDAKNIARCALEMLERGFEFKQAMVLNK